MINQIQRDEKEQKLKQMIEEKEKLTTEGKYLAAETIKTQIAEHKKRTMSQKIITLKEYQSNESEELKEQYNSELKTLNEFWDEKINAFESHVESLEEDNRNQREKDIESLINILTTSYKPMKCSKEYIDCKTLEINLGKREKYKEAHYYQVKCLKIERELIEKYNKGKDEYIRNQVEAYELKLDADFKNLQEKCKVNLSLLVIQKEKEVTKLNKKFKNRRNELNDIHLLQNRISQNENHLRAKVTANRISSLMRNTTSKLNNDNRKSIKSKHTYNNTQKSDLIDEGNSRQLPITNNNKDSNEFTLNFLEKGTANENEIGKEKESPANDDNGYLNQFIDFENSSIKEQNH